MMFLRGAILLALGLCRNTLRHAISSIYDAAPALVLCDVVEAIRNSAPSRCGTPNVREWVVVRGDEEGPDLELLRNCCNKKDERVC